MGQEVVVRSVGLVVEPMRLPSGLAERDRTDPSQVGLVYIMKRPLRPLQGVVQLTCTRYRNLRAIEHRLDLPGDPAGRIKIVIIFNYTKSSCCTFTTNVH